MTPPWPWTQADSEFNAEDGGDGSAALAAAADAHYSGGLSAAALCEGVRSDRQALHAQLAALADASGALQREAQRVRAESMTLVRAHGRSFGPSWQCHTAGGHRGRSRLHLKARGRPPPPPPPSR